MSPSQFVIHAPFVSEVMGSSPLALRERKCVIMNARGRLWVCACVFLCVSLHACVCKPGRDWNIFPKHVLWGLPEGAYSDPISGSSPTSSLVPWGR